MKPTHLFSVNVATNAQHEKDWSLSSFAEPGEGQFSSVHAKCPEGLPGERADKVFSLWQQYLYQGACGVCVVCVPPLKARSTKLAVSAVSIITKGEINLECKLVCLDTLTQTMKFNHFFSSVCLSTSLRQRACSHLYLGNAYLYIDNIYIFARFFFLSTCAWCKGYIWNLLDCPPAGLIIIS